MDFDRGHSMSTSSRKVLVVEKDKLPEVGDIVRSSTRNYKLVRILGEGGYGKVYQAEEKSKYYALKAERYTNAVLHMEISVLKAATQAKARHICELVDCGAVKPHFVFMVMTLLGKDLYKLMCDQKNRKFSLGTSVRVGVQTCDAVYELHSVGFISRDIKLGNFAIGLEATRQQRCFFLFDFGLARKYIGKDGKHVKSRQEVGWRGTMRYGSLNAHLKQDLGRRDDLESWFYCLVEFTVGTLPWRHAANRSTAYKEKVKARNDMHFFSGCPLEYVEIMQIIDSLRFEDTPPYNTIYRLLNKVRDRNGVTEHGRYDWEIEDTSATESHEQTTDTRDDLRRSEGSNRGKVRDDRQMISFESPL